MKKFILFFLILISTFISTGCVRYSYDIEIDGNDKVSISEGRTLESYLFSKSSLKGKLEQLLVRWATGYEKDYEDINIKLEDSKMGIILKKNNLSFDKASKSLPIGFKAVNEQNSFEKNVGMVKTNYRIHMIYDLNEARKTIIADARNILTQNNDMQLMEQYHFNPVVAIEKQLVSDSGSVLFVKKYANGKEVLESCSVEEFESLDVDVPASATISIKLPVRATNHNATNVNGQNVYCWEVAGDSGLVEIYIEYARYNFFKILVVLSLFILTFIAIKFSQKLNSDDPVKGL